MPEKSGGSSFKWIVVVIIVVASGAGGCFYFHRGHADAPTFNTAVVARGELTQAVTATGILNPDKSVQVGCQVSGRLRNIFVDFNSPVTNGQVIAEIDSRVYEAQVGSAEADLASAVANLELQAAQSQRTAELYTNKLVSGSDYAHGGEIELLAVEDGAVRLRLKGESLQSLVEEAVCEAAPDAASVHFDLVALPPPPPPVPAVLALGILNRA